MFPQHLSITEIEAKALWLIDPNANDDEKADFLKNLAQRGEHADEIATFVTAFLTHAIDPKLNLNELHGPCIDCCGTGGDGLNLFNVSTTSMFLIAAAGACVVKHGNRGITSKSGGADVLEALGINIQHSPDQLREIVKKIGVGFLFAPAYHPAFKAVASARKILAQQGIKSLFNLIGPLLNPVRPDYQLVGVYDRSRAETFCTILSQLGRKQAYVVHGMTKDSQGIDEVSLMGDTHVFISSASSPSIQSSILRPEQFGMNIAELEALQGDDATTNARILYSILNGDEQGAPRDMVLLNAGTALACCEIAASIEEGVELARKTLHDGSALAKLKQLQAASQ